MHAPPRPEVWAERLVDAGRHAVGLWRDSDPLVRVAVVAVGVMTAVPLASSYSPGRLGYGLIFAVLMSSVIAMAGQHLNLREVGPAATLAAVLGGWLLLSALGGGDHRLIGLFAVSLAILSAVVPWQVLRRDPGDRVVLIGLVSAAGTLGSAWAAGPMTWTAHPRLWVPRPGLPIGGASNNSVGLLLLIAGLLVMARADRRGRPIWLVLACVDVYLVVQSVSRAGMIMLLALGAFAVRRVSGSRRLAIALVGSGIAVMIAVMIQVRGVIYLGDGLRGETSMHALQAWAETPVSIVFGTGICSVWPWMVEELAWRSHRLPDTYLRQSETGEILYHAHSTYLAVLVELGLVGLLLLGAFTAVVAASALKVLQRREPLELVGLAVLLSLPAMLFELYLLRSFVSSMIWWLSVWVLVERWPRAGRPRSRP